jgi:hypothetical protein
MYFGVVVPFPPDFPASIGFMKGGLAEASGASAAAASEKMIADEIRILFFMVSSLLFKISPDIMLANDVKDRRER